MNRRLSVAVVLALLSAGAGVTPATGAAPTCTTGLVVPDVAAQIQCEGVHPGMSVIVNHPKNGPVRCSTSFLFTDQHGRRYLSVPGMCALDYTCLEERLPDMLPVPLPEPIPTLLEEVKPELPVCLLPSESEEEPVYRPGQSVVRDAKGRRIGSMAYAVNKDGVNFALIRLDGNLASSTSVPFWGGPAYQEIGFGTAASKVLLFSPASTGVNDVNARVGVAPSGWSATHFAVSSSYAPYDFGAAVMTDSGGALGFLVSSSVGWATVHRLGPALDRASAKTKLSFKLVTAPLA